MKTVFEYLDFREYLRDWLSSKKQQNPGFSLRAMAYRLECNPGFLNRIFNGQRNLSAASVLSVCKLMKLSRKEQRYFELLVLYNQAKRQVEQDHYFEQLRQFRKTYVKQIPVEQYAMYSHWYYVVLRELLHFLPDLGKAEITRSLASHIAPPIGTGEVTEAINTLKELGVIGRRHNGTLGPSERFVTSGSDIPPVVINRILIEFMDLARRSLDCCPRSERSLSTLTFSVSRKGYETVKERIEEFRRELLDIVASDSSALERVYHLNLHLFPVSKPYRSEK